MEISVNEKLKKISPENFRGFISENLDDHAVGFHLEIWGDSVVGCSYDDDLKT